MAQTKVSLIQDNVIVVGHLHTNHGITTGHIGEGSNLYFTDARVMTSLGSISTHIIPDTDITYDLGSATNRFRDLYLSGSTIHLGGDTKISVNNDGEVEFKDSSDAPKRLKVRELDFVDDQGRNKRFKIDATSGRLATFDASGTLTADKLDLSAMSTTDLAEGSNLYYTDARVGTYLTTNNYATQGYVQSQVSGLVASAPSTLDTLNELAAALGDDPNFATTVSNQIGTKWTQDNAKIANWDTAYGWGNHASVGYLTTVGWNDVTGKPSTFTPSSHTHDDRYYTEAESDARFAPKSAYDIYGTGYGWLMNDYDGSSNKMRIYYDDGTKEVRFYSYHGAVGAAKISLHSGSSFTSFGSSEISNWNTAYGWGNHASAGYQSASSAITTSNIGSQSVNYASSAGNASNADSLGGLGAAGYMRDDGWNNYPGQDADTQTAMRSDFSYSNNAPHTGDLIRFGASQYSLQLSSEYGGSGKGFSFRTRNGDVGSWNPWYQIVHAGNVGSYAAPIGGSYGTDWYANALYYDDWLRNHSNNNGIYWSGTSWHLYPKNSSDFYLRSGASDASIQFMRSGTTSAYIHNASDNAIGFLTTARSWSLRVDDNKNVWAYGSMRSPIFYDNNDTNWWIDPNSSSSAKFRQFVQIGDSSSYNTNSGSWGARLNVTDDVHARIDVAQDANGMHSYWYAHTGQSSIKFGTTSAHGVEFISNNSGRGQITSGGTLEWWNNVSAPIYYDYNDTGYYMNPAGDNRMHTIIGNYFERINHHVGHLVGSYNNIGANDTKTNPIYTIGSDYNPAVSTLSNMYGIGYSHPNASFINMTGASGWGMYVAADGDARVWLDGSQGRVSATGAAYLPIYYDYNNTSYYLDPENTLSMGYYNGGTMYLRKNSHWDSVSGIDVIGGAGEFRFSSNTGNLNVRTDGWLIAHDYVQSLNQVYGTIYYDQNNTGYYLDPDSTTSGLLRGNLRFNDYGAGITGTYTSTRIQTIFNMGSAYQIALDGSSVSGAYGLYWSHQNAGSLGGANNLGSHGLLIIENGSWKGAWGGGSLRTPGDARAPIFYDYNNTGYFCDPNGRSRLAEIDYGNSGYYFRSGDWGWRHQTPHGWIQFGPANTGHAHIYTDRSNFWFNAAINSTGDITAYASDKRLKENCKPIEGALEKVKSLTGMTYNWNDLANEIDPKVFDKTKSNVGVFAQDVQEVLPEAVKRAPFDLDEGEGTSKSGEDYLTVQYERMVPLLIEAIKEQQAQIDELKKLVSLHK